MAPLRRNDGFEDTELVLVVFGDGEAGKSSIINAVMSEKDKSPKIDAEKRTVGIVFHKYQPAQQDITLTVFSLTRQHILRNASRSCGRVP